MYDLTQPSVILLQAGQSWVLMTMIERWLQNMLPGLIIQTSKQRLSAMYMYMSVGVPNFLNSADKQNSNSREEVAVWDVQYFNRQK